MVLCRATALLGIVTLLSWSVVADAVDDKAQEEKATSTKRGGLFGKVLGNVGNEPGAILTEDEGYWERFLQATVDSVPSAAPSEPPTPAPTPAQKPCATTVGITCVDSEGNECKETPKPTNPDECIEPFTYTYTVENIGPVCMELTDWTADYIVISPDGAAQAVAIDLLPKVPVGERNICPGETFSVTNTVDTDLCQGNTYKTTTEVKAIPPDGDSCQATDEYEVTPGADCATEVKITCVDSEGNECKETPPPANPEDCIEPFTYTYTVENVGTTCMELTDWTADYIVISPDGAAQAVVINLLPKVPVGERNICPGETYSVTNTVDTDLCQGNTYKTTTEVKANPPDGNSCQATDEYEVTPPAPCKTEVDITCVDSEGNECKETPPPANPDECIEPFTYTYTVENVGPTCMDLIDWTADYIVITPSGAEQAILIDLLPKVPVGQRNICPGETFSVTNTVDTDLCQGNTYKTTTEVMANPPNGDSCQATDEYEVTPGAGCVTTVEITCVDSEGNECKETPKPNNPDECIEPFTYTYTVENVGSTCMELTEWSADFITISPDGAATAVALDLLPEVPVGERNLCPGDTFSVTNTVDTDLCQGNTYTTTTQVEASPPNGNLCQATDEYTVTIQADCLAEVEISCVDSEGRDCEDTPVPSDPSECLEPFTYTYTVENVGPTCMELTQWTRTREIIEGDGTVVSSETDDLLPLVPLNQREICPGQTFSVTDSELTSLCQGYTYSTTTAVEASPPDGELCQATDEYVVTPNAPCDVDIEIGCTNPDGIECTEIPEPANPEDCVQDITYTYTITNEGPTCMEFISWTRTRDGVTESIIDLLPPGVTEICPGEPDIVVTEIVSTQICTEQCYDTSTIITARPPNGESCEATDDYTFCVAMSPSAAPSEPPSEPPSPAPTPPPTPAPTPEPSPAPSAMPSVPPTGGNCNVQVRTECSTEASTVGGSGDCNAIIPIITRCEQRATFMEMLFNGGDCDQSFNIQEADKFDCTDFNGGPGLSGSYWIHVVPRKDPEGDVYFSGQVQVGSVFPMCPGFPSCSGERFEADSTIFIYDGNPGADPVNNPGAPLVQLVNYHTSCSQNLFLKDKYGSTQLVIFFNEEQGLVSCFITATFSITITNQGAADAAEIVLFTNTVNGNTTDLTSAITDIQPDEIVVVTTQILIDMTVRQEYTVTTAIVGETLSGRQCSDSDTITFTAGNDLGLPPGQVGV